MNVFANKIEKNKIGKKKVWQIFLNNKWLLQIKTRQGIGQSKLAIYGKVNLFKVIKVIAKLEIIVTIPGNIKKLHIQYAIYALKKINLFQ